MEQITGAGQEELVLHDGRGRALGDPWLDVVRLDPLRQPSHAAVAVERIGAESSGKNKVINGSSRWQLNEVILRVSQFLGQIQKKRKHHSKQHSFNSLHAVLSEPLLHLCTIIMSIKY